MNHGGGTHDNYLDQSGINVSDCSWPHSRCKFAETFAKCLVVLQCLYPWHVAISGAILDTGLG